MHVLAHATAANPAACVKKARDGRRNDKPPKPHTTPKTWTWQCAAARANAGRKRRSPRQAPIPRHGQRANKWPCNGASAGMQRQRRSNPATSNG
eukprot:15391462-Alexandrium_andersonii.AAC.1